MCTFYKDLYMYSANEWRNLNENYERHLSVINLSAKREINLNINTAHNYFLT